jgi:hypothetical protein
MDKNFTNLQLLITNPKSKTHSGKCGNYAGVGETTPIDQYITYS